MAPWFRLSLAFALTLSFFILGSALSPASASQIGPQITLNPGGGQQPDGTDGIQFSINVTTGTPLIWGSGKDSLFYRGNNQYCCTAAGPMLNIGGELFGQAGPADGMGSDWEALDIVSTSGATSVGAPTAVTGDASVTVLYTAVHDGLEFRLDRTVDYTFPNDFVTESYTLHIPEGNTHIVKFYHGGDTAPGGSDGAYGLATTTPVRSIMSVNHDSRVLIGYREISGSKPFGGAYAADFDAPYAAVQDGEDIGFTVDTDHHDAGLMMQWTFGSEPGTHQAAMQTFVTSQGNNLSASFSSDLMAVGHAFDLTLSMVNTWITYMDDLGFTFEVPTGLEVVGTMTNSCDGTLSMSDGTLTLSGGSVAAVNDCHVTIPVAATAAGTVTVSAANASALNNVTNTIGTSSVTVQESPTWVTSSIEPLRLGNAVNQELQVDGTPTFTFEIVSGALASGLTLTTEGVLTGTPETAGDFSVTVRASNAVGSSDRTFTGTVAKIATSLNATLTPDTTTVGETATVTVTGLPIDATGIVEVSADGRTLCQATVEGGSCLLDGDIAAGTHDLLVTYLGDEQHESSSTTVMWTVNAAANAGRPTTAAVGALPATGAGSAAWGVFGALLLTAGGLTLGRRHRV